MSDFKVVGLAVFIKVVRTNWEEDESASIPIRFEVTEGQLMKVFGSWKCKSLNCFCVHLEKRAPLRCVEVRARKCITSQECRR
jgi:hypothetical protein